MNSIHLIPLLSFLCVAVVSADDQAKVAPPEQWPGFRGSGNSTLSSAELPLEWSPEKGIAWQADLAGFGQSSPVIWDQHLYVTSTDGEQKEKLLLESFDLATGEQRWLREFPATQKVEQVSRMVSQGAPTPVVDAEGVYAFFESGNLVALDHEGESRWQRDLVKEFGPFKGVHGLGSSLVGVPDRLVLLIDHDGPSYLLCLDRATGKTIWKKDREPRISWSTPLSLVYEGEEQLVISSSGGVEGYRLEDGERLWWVDNVQKNTVASPSTDGSLVVIGSSAPRFSYAIRLGGRGDVSKTHLAWRPESVTSSFASPLIAEDTVYYINRAGTLQAQRLADGTQRWEHRLPGPCWASPLKAGNRLYFFCKNGRTVVLDAEAPEPKLLAENAIAVDDDDVLYGFAVGGGRVVMRTSREIVCAGE